jgi:hypothetical protein
MTKDAPPTIALWPAEKPPKYAPTWEHIARSYITLTRQGGFLRFSPEPVRTRGAIAVASPGPPNRGCRRDDSQVAGLGQRFDHVWQNPNPDRPVWILFTQLQAAADSFVMLSKVREWLRAYGRRLCAHRVAAAYTRGSSAARPQAGRYHEPAKLRSCAPGVA